MARTCVQDRCGLCNRELGEEDPVLLLERADLTRTSLAGSKALREGTIRVGERAGKKLAWCSDCWEIVFQKLYGCVYSASPSMEGQ